MTLTFHTLICSISCLQLTTFRSQASRVSEKSTVFNFSYRKACYQIWPGCKLGQGQPWVNIWKNYDGLESQMLHTKFCGNLSTGFGVENFWKVFTIYGCGSHLGHVTSIMFMDFHFLVSESFHTKFSSERHKILIFVCTRPLAKVKKWPWPSILTYLHKFNKMSAPTNFQVTCCNSFWKIHCFHFPYRKAYVTKIDLAVK